MNASGARLSISSPPSSSSGAWDRPAVELQQTAWEVHKPISHFTIEGSIDLDTRFFTGPNGYEHEFSITLALMSALAPGHPIDWNTEGPSARNPHSFIRLDRGRITIDEHFVCVPFTIELPTLAQWFPRPGEAYAFGVKVKAFAIYEPKLVTATNETPFVVVNRIGRIPSERRMSRQRS